MRAMLRHHATPLEQGIFSRLPGLLLTGLLALLCALALPQARAAGAAATPAAVDELRQQLDAIPQKPGDEDEGRKRLADINAIGQAAEQLAQQRASDLAELDQRLTGLGPAPQKGAPADAPDVAAQRASLTRQRAALDADLKLARLLALDAEQRGTELLRQRRAQFRETLAARTNSPLAPGFWRNLRNAAPGDMARLASLGEELGEAMGAGMQAPQRGGLAGYLALALILLAGGTWLAERILMRVLPPYLPSARLRRSLLALLAILANAVAVGLALQLIWSGIALGGPLSERLQALQQASMRAAAYAAFAITLGHVLLSRKRSSWRLLPIDDAQARRLSPFPWWLGTLAPLGVLMADINAIIGASLAAEVLVHTVFALLLSVAVAKGISQIRGGTLDAVQPAAPARQPLWLVLIMAAAGIAVLTILVGLALGYVALAGLLARQMVWSGVVFATTYLMFQLAEDLSEALLSSRSGFGARLHRGLGVDSRLLDQVAVLASGALRLLLFFYMIVALMAPFGTGVDEVFRRGSSGDHHLKVGDITLAPQALLTALAVVVTGLVAIRIFKRWLSDSYFPHTTLEPGMRSSIVTLSGYVGLVVVVAVALAGLGISVERIAWVASALSVGIGFGLQAIVQNFISGLILLAEQPVKVGDWVVLGDTEGDVRRVNVRATEIQLGDRSTLIVPNSEFITKTVRNMTLGSVQGRVLLRLPAPLDTDARRMRELILQAFRAHQAILDEPAPSVTLEGIHNGTLTFLAIGYVTSPRQSSGVRSEVLFAVLDALRAAGLALSPPASTSVAQAPREPVDEPAPPAGKA